jgi:hypothetical protein
LKKAPKPPSNPASRGMEPRAKARSGFTEPGWSLIQLIGHDPARKPVSNSELCS